MFNKKVLQEAISHIDAVKLEKAYEIFLSYQNNQDLIKTLKEEEYQDGFLRKIFVECLGYTLKPDPNFNLTREEKNATDGKKADGAIVIDGEVRGVIELKDTKTKNLDEVQAQAFGYKVSHKNTRYVIISNFAKLRFYIDDKTEYYEFDLFNMPKKDFDKFYLFLHFKHIASNLPISLKQKSIQEEQDISNRLYKDFKAFRAALFENILKNNPNLDKSKLLSATSKLCDRFVFIAFAEDKGLLPAQTIANLIASHQSSHKGFGTKEPLYNYYKNLFDAIDKGDARNSIDKFNGGLFCSDEFLNSLVIDDFVLDLTPICKYDFVSDVSVNILGHIFEQSLNDLDEMNAIISGEKLEKSATKRKKDGIFYTPEFITRYIVDETLGKICDDKKTRAKYRKYRRA